MILRTLEIRRQQYGDNEGKYTAEIRYEGDKGTVNLLLDAEVSNALLVVIGPVITKFSQKAAVQLENSIARSVLEAQKSPALEALNPVPETEAGNV